MFSCSQDENLNDTSTSIQLRSDTSPAEISDLSGLEVGIRLANSDRKSRYLSAHKSKNSADLTDKGNDSWQKWYILSDRYKPGVGMSSDLTFDLKTNSSPKYGSYLFIHDNWKYPSLTNTAMGANPLWHFHRISGTSFYRIGLLYGNGTMYYLSAVDDSSSALCFEPQSTINSKRQAWEIVPLEGFDLITIDYDLKGGTIANKTIKTFQVLPAINQSQYTINRNFTINQKYTESSTFSQTEGIKLSTNMTTSFSVGVPGVSGGQISSSITSEKSWSYSESTTQTKEYSIIDTYACSIPPYSTLTISAIGLEYTLEVGYTAVYRSKISGKTIRLNGTWKGVTVSETQIILKDASDNVIDSKPLNPTINK